MDGRARSRSSSQGIGHGHPGSRGRRRRLSTGLLEVLSQPTRGSRALTRRRQRLNEVARLYPMNAGGTGPVSAGPWLGPTARFPQWAARAESRLLRLPVLVMGASAGRDGECAFSVARWSDRSCVDLGGGSRSDRASVAYSWQRVAPGGAVVTTVGRSRSGAGQSTHRSTGGCSGRPHAQGRPGSRRWDSVDGSHDWVRTARKARIASPSHRPLRPSAVHPAAPPTHPVRTGPPRNWCGQVGVDIGR